MRTAPISALPCVTVAPTSIALSMPASRDDSPSEPCDGSVSYTDCSCSWAPRLRSAPNFALELPNSALVLVEFMPSRTARQCQMLKSVCVFSCLHFTFC